MTSPKHAKGNPTAPVMPKLSHQERVMLNIRDAHGRELQRQADSLGIGVEAAAAVMSVESGGKGLTRIGNADKPKIRFENHRFFDLYTEKGKNRERVRTMHEHFAKASGQRWLGHRFRAAIDGTWQDCHQSQAQEYQVFEFARALDETAALKSISMGLGQIMGDAYRQIGYHSPQEMFLAFHAETAQVDGLFEFIRTKPGCLPALKAGDYVEFAKHYNGPGQAVAYGARINAAVDSYRQVVAKVPFGPATTPTSAAPSQAPGRTGAEAAVMAQAIADRYQSTGTVSIGGGESLDQLMALPKLTAPALARARALIALVPDEQRRGDLYKQLQTRTSGAPIGGAAARMTQSRRVGNDGDLTGPFYPDNWKGHRLDSEEATDAQRKSAIRAGAGVFVNGIRVNYQQHEQSAQELAKATGHPIVGVYNATEGTVKDLLQCASDKLGDLIPNKATATMKALILELGDAKKHNGGLNIYAHSQGSIIVSEALRQAKKDGADIRNEEITTFGNAAWTMPAGAKAYHNYVFDSDLVPTTVGSASMLGRIANLLPLNLLGLHATAQDTTVLHHTGGGIRPHGAIPDPVMENGKEKKDADGHTAYDGMPAYFSSLKQFQDKEARFNAPPKGVLGDIGRMIPNPIAATMSASRSLSGTMFAMLRGAGSGLSTAVASGYGGLDRTMRGLPSLPGLKSNTLWGGMDWLARWTGNKILQGGELVGRGADTIFNEWDKIQRSGHGDHPDVNPTALRANLLRQGGMGFMPDSGMREKLGGHLGFDPSGARLHRGPEAARAARSLNAEAFTIGQDVFFGEGKYDPATSQGLGLIAHELTHVGQQTGTIGNKARFFSTSGGDKMEQEAQHTADRVMTNVGRRGGLFVEDYIRHYEGATGHGLSPADQSRLDRISLLALHEAETQVLAAGMSPQTQLDLIQVEIALDLGEQSDQALAQTWAAAIVAGITTQAGPHTAHTEKAGASRPLDPSPLLQRAWSDAHAVTGPPRSGGHLTDEQKTDNLRMLPPPAAASGGFTPPGAFWNAQDVVTGGSTRMPLEGLPGGKSGMSPKALEDSGGGKAIVYKPANVDVTKPVDVLLHFHGMNIGYRQRIETSAPDDVVGTVRDLARDNIAAQVNSISSRMNLIVVLPQGTTTSGEFAIANYPDYVKAAFNSIGMPSATLGRVAISGHSGAASLLNRSLTADPKMQFGGQMHILAPFDALYYSYGDNETARPKNPDKRLDAQEANAYHLQKAKGSSDYLRMTGWITSRLNEDLAALTTKGATADQLAYLDTSAQFHGKHTNSPYYAYNYMNIESDIRQWFGAHSRQFDPSVVARWKQNYTVDTVPSAHDDMMGKGDLFDSIMRHALDGTAPDEGPQEDLARRVGDAVMRHESPSQPLMARTFGMPASSVARHSIQRQEAPVAAVAKTEWDAHAGIKAAYPKLEDYTAVRAIVVGLGVTNPAEYIEQAITESNGHAGIKAQYPRLEDYMAVRRKVEKMGIAPPADAIEQAITESNAHTGIKARYTKLEDYLKVRHDVSKWGVPNPADYIEQTITEWDANTGMHGYLGGNFDGDPHRSFLNLRRLYQAKGVPNVGTYLASMQSTSFFGKNITGTAGLITALNAAQTALTAAGKTYQFDAESGGLVPRTFNDNIDQLSDHALGKAVDLNPGSNPQIPQSADKAVLVIDTLCHDLLPNGLRATQDYDTQKQASDAFKTRFNAVWVKSQQDDLKTKKDALDADKKKVVDLKKHESDATKAIAKAQAILTKNPNDPDSQSKLTQAQNDQTQAQQQMQALTVTINQEQTEFTKQKDLVAAISASRSLLDRFQATGFLSLDKDLVTALTAQGLTWGGTWPGRKDYMHFQLP